MGDEPEGPISSDSDFGKRLNWYHYMGDKEDARQYLKDWLVTQKMTGLLFKKIDSIPDAWIPFGSAWRARIASRGTQLTLEQDNKILADIKFAIAKGAKEPVLNKAEGTSIQDRVRERVSEIIGDVEEMLDKGDPISMYEWLQKNEIPAAHAKKIAEYYKPLRDEYVYAISTDKEGYERFTKNQLKAKFNAVNGIIEDCERFSGNVKKARAPRKKKAPTADKLLKLFQYQKEFNEMKIQSVSPESILGASELWTYNTKYKTLSVFRARGPAGLTVKRTSIDGYDVDTSMTKRIGRKPEEYIKKVLSGGKIVIRKIMDDIKSDTVAFSDRINLNIILLKITK